MLLGNKVTGGQCDIRYNTPYDIRFNTSWNFNEINRVYWNEHWWMGHVTLAVITGINIQVTYLLGMSLQFIWRSNTLCVGWVATAIAVERHALLYTGLILILRPAIERRCYFVTTSLIGCAQAYNQSWYMYSRIIAHGANIICCTCTRL